MILINLFKIHIFNSTCKKSQWKCSNDICPKRCSVVGDPHYTTFDGYKYDFSGQCSYTLVKHVEFQIEAENAQCSADVEYIPGRHYEINNPPTCTRALIIRLENASLKLKQGKEVLYNGEEIVNFPKLLPNKILIVTSSSIWLTGFIELHKA